jgi:endonuclease I
MKKTISFIFLLIVAMAVVSCTGTSTTTEQTALTTAQSTEVTTGAPTTLEPTTSMPATTFAPTTIPVTQAPTTLAPTTQAPTTSVPTTSVPTTTVVTTVVPTTEYITTETLTTTEPLELVDVYISDQTKTFYQLNDAFDPSTVVLTALFNNDDQLEITSDLYRVRSFNSTSAGIKTAYFTYDQFLIEYHYVVLEEYAFEIEMAYYQDAINLRGELLKVTLNNIISENFIPLLYADAIEVLENSDMDPDNPNNVILVYPGIYGVSVPTGYSETISGYYWNREHVWPQSRLGVNVSYTDDFPSKATDVHNLKPADGDENASRSNDYFDYIDGPDTYEPRDEVKGDIARILFYMATRYFDLTLNDDIYSASSEKTMGILSVLLEWNELDPVDDFERNRNEVIYSYQGNRNPFIDYPGFAELIWGEAASE